MPGLENSGDGQLFWQNDIAQLVDGRFLFVALGVLESLNPVEDLSEIARRINGQLVADTDLQFARDVDPEHDRFAVEIQLPLLNELLAAARRSPPVLGRCRESLARVDGFGIRRSPGLAHRARSRPRPGNLSIFVSASASRAECLRL